MSSLEASELSRRARIRAWLRITKECIMAEFGSWDSLMKGFVSWSSFIISVVVVYYVIKYMPYLLSSVHVNETMSPSERLFNQASGIGLQIIDLAHQCGLD